jgi:hypothetical protein
MRIPRQPKYPVGELATWELRDYREQLEKAEAHFPADSAERQIIASRLLSVVAEQNSRSSTSEVPGQWAPDSESVT